MRSFHHYPGPVAVERPRDWVTKIRSDPKGAMEADLYVCGFGLVMAVPGGLSSVTGYHR
jgi:hypothetical protein